jgi:hypothetical protein
MMSHNCFWIQVFKILSSNMEETGLIKIKQIISTKLKHNQLLCVLPCSNNISLWNSILIINSSHILKEKLTTSNVSKNVLSWTWIFSSSFSYWRIFCISEFNFYQILNKSFLINLVYSFNIFLDSSSFFSLNSN